MLRLLLFIVNREPSGFLTVAKYWLGTGEIADSFLAQPLRNFGYLE